MKPGFFIYVSLAVDLLIAVSKFIAAAFTGSASMLSEGVHSVIDAVSQLLLLWGIKTSKKKPDEKRPFGYGKELYFWSFMVSLILFVVGGCISFYEGINRIKNPGFDGNPVWNYAVLAIAFIFTLISMASALKTFNRQRAEVPFWEALVKTKDPSTIIVLLGDIGDMLGLAIAFCGVFFGRLFHNPYFDGIASIIIGIILLGISGFLLRECKSLLMGESINRKTLRSITKSAENDEAVIRVKKNYSMYLAPDELLLHLDIVFKAALNTKDITDANERIIAGIQKQFPRIKQIFIEAVAP
ncbi:MAG: cation diffusion facilitator family transporter [Ferruginibacter sp.]